MIRGFSNTMEVPVSVFVASLDPIHALTICSPGAATSTQAPLFEKFEKTSLRPTEATVMAFGLRAAAKVESA